VRFDLAYVNSWSLPLDAKILAKTIPAVISGQGGRVSHEVHIVTSQARGVNHANESNGSNGSVHPDRSSNGGPLTIEAWASEGSTE